MKTIAEMEQELIVERLEYFEGNKTQASLSLGITIKTLYNKLHEYGLFERYKVGARKVGAHPALGAPYSKESVPGSEY